MATVLACGGFAAVCGSAIATACDRILAKARRLAAHLLEAAEADVVVVNHHLLASDLAVRRAQGNWEDAAVLPPYRRLFTAVSISNVGQQMTSVAVGIQVYELTHRSFAVGLVGLFQLIPLVALGLLLFVITFTVLAMAKLLLIRMQRNAGRRT